jgi:hypothetical protein
VALAGFLVANSLHAVSHAIDLDVGGHAGDPYAIGVVSLLVAATLVLRVRQRRSPNPVPDTGGRSRDEQGVAPGPPAISTQGRASATCWSVASRACDAEERQDSGGVAGVAAQRGDAAAAAGAQDPDGAQAGHGT